MLESPESAAAFSREGVGLPQDLLRKAIGLWAPHSQERRANYQHILRKRTVAGARNIEAPFPKNVERHFLDLFQRFGVVGYGCCHSHEQPVYGLASLLPALAAEGMRPCLAFEKKLKLQPAIERFIAEGRLNDDLCQSLALVAPQAELMETEPFALPVRRFSKMGVFT